jgi:hypothetical protein
MEQKTVEVIQGMLEIWDVSYNESEAKYIAVTNSYFPLSPDVIEQISHLGLTIFSVRKHEDSIIVKFSSGGCSH